MIIYACVCMCRTQTHYSLADCLTHHLTDHTEKQPEAYLSRVTIPRIPHSPTCGYASAITRAAEDYAENSWRDSVGSPLPDIADVRNMRVTTMLWQLPPLMTIEIKHQEYVPVCIDDDDSIRANQYNDMIHGCWMV